jgi:tetratricopeptide (TPR) repeat protein
LAEQAKILVAEAEENNLDDKVLYERFNRWDTCGLCEQNYHGVVRCALGWACWKTYVGRPEADNCRRLAMNVLGNGLCDAKHHEDALSVREAELAMKRRLGAPVQHMLVAKCNLSFSYSSLGRYEDAMRLKREVFSGRLKLNGAEHEETLRAANNYAWGLLQLRRFDLARALMRKTIPVARRVLGENHDLRLVLPWAYARALYLDIDATLDDLREAVSTLEDADQIARRILGGAHPDVVGIEESLRFARKVLRIREAPDA